MFYVGVDEMTLTLCMQDTLRYWLANELSFELREKLIYFLAQNDRDEFIEWLDEGIKKTDAIVNGE